MSDPMHDLFEKLGRIEAKQDTMGKDISDIKRGVNDYWKTKNKLIGGCLTLSAFVGGGISAFLNKFGIHI